MADYKYALQNSDGIIVTVPSFIIENNVNKLKLFNPKIIYYILCYGSKEFFSQSLIQKSIIIAGVERIPFYSKITK